MIKTVNVGRYSTVRLPDTFELAVIETNKGSREVKIHFGSNLDIVVCVAKDRKLSRENVERIRILTDVKSDAK